MSKYFSHLPNIMVGDSSDDSTVSNFVKTKNLFRRSRVLPDALKNFTFFQRYTIPGNFKPYQVSHAVYGTPNYEWVILITNDITNIYTQWPLSSEEFDKKIRTVYGVGDKTLDTKCWRTKEFKTPEGVILVPGGLIVPESYTYRLPNGEFIPKNRLIERVTYYEYEVELNESKRNIQLVFPSVIERFITEYDQALQYPNHSDLIQGEENTKNPGNESFNRLT